MKNGLIKLNRSVKNNCKNIRVAHVVGKMNGGGVEAFLLNFQKGLCKYGIYFDYIVDSDSKHVPYNEILKYGGRVFFVPPYSKVISYCKVLHKLILEDIESFMKELGNSFAFIGSEYKIKIGDRNHYIDLLLFNIRFNCYVVIELKTTEFKVEYISQVQKYMNYIDKNVKEQFNNNTMGILICKRENRFVIEYCSDERIAVREYELV